MDRFHIWDVVSVLGLPQAPSGQSSYNIQCPYCDDRPRDRHLNINLKKEVFRCPKCGTSGGIFDLYSLYTGIARDQVRKEMLERLGHWDSRRCPVPKRKQAAMPEEKETLAAGIEVRDRTYTALLSRLSLASDHLENLRKRGLTEKEAEDLSYRSTPALGMEKIVRDLEKEGCVLSGVPGFYRTEEGRWRFMANQRGILIPVRDAMGRIQGLQVRRDDAGKRKFRWVSSRGLKDGCSAETWTHLAGRPAERMLITEGPMKADIIHILSGQSVIAVPGVNALTHLKEVLKQMKEEGLDQIMTAFDMDMSVNPHVQKGYRELLSLLSGMGFKFGTYLWDGSYKGLDDYIWECQMDRKRPE